MSVTETKTTGEHPWHGPFPDPCGACDGTGGSPNAGMCDACKGTGVEEVPA